MNINDILLPELVSHVLEQLPPIELECTASAVCKSWYRHVSARDAIKKLPWLLTLPTPVWSMFAETKRKAFKKIAKLPTVTISPQAMFDNCQTTLPIVNADELNCPIALINYGLPNRRLICLKLDYHDFDEDTKTTLIMHLFYCSVTDQWEGVIKDDIIANIGILDFIPLQDGNTITYSIIGLHHAHVACLIQNKVLDFPARSLQLWQPPTI